MNTYFVTGNEYVSLPTLRNTDGAVEGVTFLHMGAKGMLEVRGNASYPFLKPFVRYDGIDQPLTQPHFSRAHAWIPTFTAQLPQNAALSCTYLCPLDTRGFVIHMTLKNAPPVKVEYGLYGCYAQTLHEVNESKPVQGEVCAYKSGWNHNFVMDLRLGLPLFAIAPIYESATITSAFQKTDAHTVQYTLTKTADAGQTTADFYFGFGYEEVAAATSAKHMLRVGYEALHKEMEAFLCAREKHLDDPVLREILNLNMFFSFFYASGKTLDTEEFCLMTSRSPRYYVSAAYWDRDSLLWSFPAILMADSAYAREILRYVFSRQIRNVGIHSRFIDGTVLEPGFELDELCAPVLALSSYIKQTKDTALLHAESTQQGLLHILSVLESKKHPHIALYETFLQPTDDMHVYPYLTYDNVLVFQTLHLLADFLKKPILHEHAEAVKAAIYAHCVQEKNGRRFFVWSTDLLGHYDIYDEPPGSLMLLTYYEFCEPNDEIYQNTVSMIRDPAYAWSFAGKPIAEIGCPHAPHPWVLSICNSLLCGHAATALEHLKKTSMDNGVACESIDEYTGESATGNAFATCAGFLAFALEKAIGGKTK